MARVKPNVLKMRRQRRAWNRYGNVRSGITVNQSTFKEYQLRARSMGTPLPEDFNDAPFELQTIKRAADLSNVGQDMSLFYRGPGPWNCYQRTRMYFNPQKTCWILVYQDLRKRIEMRSIVYSSDDLIRQLWLLDKITWVSATPLPS